MAFQQLYYTSCEHGVAGYAGFQFNAVSQGVGAKVMREVEQLTVYELPSWDSSASDAPVNMCHVRDAARGGTIIANVIYAGTDFSGRAGNYFAHALVAEDPGRDLAGLLPVEMWESPVWSHTVADSTVLPVIHGALPRGSFDRPTVAAFLAAQDNAPTVLARLLSAVDKALDGGRSLILWSPTSADNAKWIAAVSYLLEGPRAREMSFFTYTRRPAQCRAHVIGTVPGAVTSLAALAESFRVFDMTSGTLPDVPTHPLAELLTQVGVVRAAGLWRQAATLAAGTERSFDEWYPIASAAAVLLGVELLPSAAVDAIAGWLPGAALRSPPLSAPHIVTVLTVLLDRHAELSDDQLQSLLPTAQAARTIGQLQRIEVVLVNRAIAQLEHGRPPHDATPIGTTEASQLAIASCERLLGSADAAATLTVLDWARQSHLRLDPLLLERCSRQVVGPALSALGNDRRVVQVGQAYRAFAQGVAGFLVAAGPDTALQLLGGVAGEVLDRSDLRRYPQLREMLLLEEVRSGQLPPVQALRELIELRPPSAPPWSDKYLMAHLWPTGLSIAEATELLPLLDGDLRGTVALTLLDVALQLPDGIADINVWLDLAAQVLAHPVCAQLPPATRMRVKALQGIDDTVDRARHLMRQGDMSWYAPLDDRFGRLPADPGDLLRQYLATLTLAAPRPWEQLATCSWPVFDAACARARTWLERDPPDRRLAARLFQSFHQLGHAPRARQLETTALVPTIPRWSRGDRGEVAAILKQQAKPSLWRNRETSGKRIPRRQRPEDLSGAFRSWCEQGARAGGSDIETVPSGWSAILWRRGRPRAGPK